MNLFKEMEKYPLSDEDIDTMKLYAKATRSSRSMKIADLIDSYRRSCDESLDLRQRQEHRDRLFNITYRYVYRIAMKNYQYILDTYPAKTGVVSFADVISVVCHYLFNHSALFTRMINGEQIDHLRPLTIVGCFSRAKFHTIKKLSNRINRASSISADDVLRNSSDSGMFETTIINGLSHRKTVDTLVVPVMNKLNDKYRTIIREKMLMEEAPSYTELSVRTGVSRQRILQVVHNTRKKSRSAIWQKLLVDDDILPSEAYVFVI